MFAVGENVKVRDGVTVTEGLGGAVCRVVGVQGDLRDVRRIDPVTGKLVGIEVRFLAAELESAR